MKTHLTKTPIELTTYIVRNPGDPNETEGVEYTCATEDEAKRCYLADFWSGEWVDVDSGGMRFTSNFAGELDDLEAMVVIDGAGA